MQACRKDTFDGVRHTFDASPIRKGVLLFHVALFVTLAWGALAFGAVYPWAYIPLGIAVATLGCWGLLARSIHRQHRDSVSLVAVLAIFAIAVSVQLIPLGQDLRTKISPAAEPVLRGYDMAFAVAAASEGVQAHALTIGPRQTTRGLFLFVCLATFFVGLVRALDGVTLRRLVPGIIVLGVLLALIGIIQKPLFNGKMYGLWEPYAGFERHAGIVRPGKLFFVPFGPFVNRNHFAGWMLMALPLAIGYFNSVAARGMRGVKLHWRDRVIWFSTREATSAILFGLAIGVMGLALMMTLSRSGIACFAAALFITGVTVARRQRRNSTRGLFLGYLMFIAIISVSWAGLDAVVARFQEADQTLGGRLPVWRDTWRVFEAFPWTGTGFNTYGIAMLFYQTFNTDVVHYAEAHNDYLQLLAEGGLLLAIPAVVVVGLFIWQVRARFHEQRDDTTGYWLRVGAVTGIVAIAAQEIVEFSLQIPGNAALFALICAIAVRKASGAHRALADVAEMRAKA